MQSNFTILWPVFALATWTFCILVFVGLKRVLAGVSGKVHPLEYALGESQHVPVSVSLPNRNYMNLLELPLLFYLVCVIAYVTNNGTHQLMYLAWAYVGLRVIHSFIHVTYNHIMHRFVAFAISNIILATMWVHVALALKRAT